MTKTDHNQRQTSRNCIAARLLVAFAMAVITTMVAGEAAEGALRRINADATVPIRAKPTAMVR